MRDKLGETLKQRLWDEYQPTDQQEEEGGPPEGPALSSKLAQYAAGFVSLALVFGAVYWVFELGRRDANEVPVIQAMGGVARELPANSGGAEVDNQGLQVNEVLGNSETAPIEPETRLAPPPQRVVAEDVLPLTTTEPVAGPAILTPVNPAEGINPAAPATPESPAFTLPPSLPGADPNMTRPQRRVLASTALPESADLLSNAIADAIREATTEDTAVVPDNAPAPSPAPQASAVPFTPAFIGEKMIQLGAYDDEDSANRDYDALLIDNQDLMGRLVRFVERREAGGRVFYRLRARGFTSMDEAAAMCEALLARSIQCIAVTAR